MDLAERRRLLSRKGSDNVGRWVELGKVTAENDGDSLLINDFDATIVKITGMIAVTDTNAMGFGISFNPEGTWQPPNIIRAQVLNNELKPFSITAEVVGNYIVADIPSPIYTSYQVDGKSGKYTGACQCYVNGKITKVCVYSTNGTIAKGSWIKVEVWEQ